MVLDQIIGSLVGSKSKSKVSSSRQVIYVVQRSPTLEERLEEFFEHGILSIMLYVVGTFVASEMYSYISEQFRKQFEEVTSGSS